MSISPDVSVGLRPKRPITEFCRPNQLAARSARVFAQPVDADSARHPVIEKLASISGGHLELGKRYERYDKLN
jgi:hypothetical protein